MTTTEGQATTDADLGGEVELGSALFTLVEPHKGHEVAYNRWYERDHFYAGCMNGPFYFSGRRWVSTRDLKDLRIGSSEPLFGDDRAGSYLALYWTPKGRFRDNTDWSTRQVHWLHANGRMFAERDHIHTLLYLYKGASARGAWGPAGHGGCRPPGAAAVVCRRRAGRVVGRGRRLRRRRRRRGHRHGALGVAVHPHRPGDRPLHQPALVSARRRTPARA